MSTNEESWAMLIAEVARRRQSTLLPVLTSSTTKIRSKLAGKNRYEEDKFVVPSAKNACALEASYYILLAYCAGRRVCDIELLRSSHTTAKLHLLRGALLEADVRKSDLTGSQYQAMVGEIRKATNLFASSSGLPDVMNAWNVMAEDLASFSFTTVCASICPCGSRQTDEPVRRTSIPPPVPGQLYFREDWKPFLKPCPDNVGDLVSMFFSRHFTGENCVLCGSWLFKRHVLLDRLPLYLMVECPPKGPSESQTKPSVWTCALDFRYGLPTGTFATAKVHSEKAVLIGDGWHVVSCIAKRGIKTSGFVKDSQSSGSMYKTVNDVDKLAASKAVAAVLLYIPV